MAGIDAKNIQSTRTRSGTQNPYNDQMYFQSLAAFDPRYERVGLNITMIQTRIYRSPRILPMETISADDDADITFSDAIVIPNDLDEQLPEVILNN